MKTFAVSLTTVLGLALLTIGAVKLTGAQAQTDRPDCPGKITCPQTGKLICRDKCPVVDSNRPDCPGLILCPETGKLVCKDRCPMNSNINEKPSCCADKKK